MHLCDSGMRKRLFVCRNPRLKVAFHYTRWFRRQIENVSELAKITHAKYGKSSSAARTSTCQKANMVSTMATTRAMISISAAPILCGQKIPESTRR
jgi:hypothetical protein